MSEVDLEILSRYLRRLKPSYVLELGCGESTIRTARALAEIHGDAVTRLLTVEQDRRFAELCSARLAAEGLNATVVHRPLVSQPIPGGDTQSYDLDALDVGAAPDLIVIDGPSGGRLVRYPVLPGIRRYLAHPTPFLLHDGLRDYELLRVAGAWQQIAGIRVGGVYAGGEGFLTGTVTP